MRKRDIYNTNPTQKTSKAPGKKGDRSNSDPKSREEEKPRDGGEGERGVPLRASCSSSSGVRIGGARRDSAAWGLEKGWSPSPATQSYGDACRRHRGSPSPARCMWSSGPPGRRSGGGAIDEFKAVTTCGDRTACSTCQGGPHAEPACLPACRCDGGPGAALVISSSGRAPPAAGPTQRDDSLEALDRGGGAGPKGKGKGKGK